VAAFIVRRLIQGIVVVILVATIVFALLHAAPGDPFSSAMENPYVTEAVRDNWRHVYGLDLPLVEQFFRFVSSVSHGDLGFSTAFQRPVKNALADAFPYTLVLMTFGLTGGFLLGMTVAVVQARSVGKRADKILGGISLAFFSVPDFLFARLMLLAFVFWFGFPPGGSIDVRYYDYMDPAAQIVDRLEHLFVPALTLALLYFPLIARHQRAALLDTLPSEFIVTARAKGVSESRLVTRHALRNSLLPVVTLLGVAFPALFTGAVFVETIFSWPGMGSLIVKAISGRDYPLLTTAVIFASAFVVMGSIAADVLYRWLDPRLRSDS